MWKTLSLLEMLLFFCSISTIANIQIYWVHQIGIHIVHTHNDHVLHVALQSCFFVFFVTNSTRPKPPPVPGKRTSCAHTSQIIWTLVLGKCAWAQYDYKSQSHIWTLKRIFQISLNQFDDLSPFPSDCPWEEKNIPYINTEHLKWLNFHPLSSSFVIYTE